MLRHAKLDSHAGSNVEDGPCLIRTDSFSGVFASSPCTTASKDTRTIRCQHVATGLAMLVMLMGGVTMHMYVQRIEAHALEMAAALRETRHALEARDALVTSILRQVTTSQSELLDNLHALKQEQVNVAARIPSVLTGDIVPQLDRVEAAVDARPACGFTSMDRVHLNRLAVSLKKIGERVDEVEDRGTSHSPRTQDHIQRGNNAGVKNLLFGKERQKRTISGQRTTPRLADGLVQVTFGLKGTAVNLFWLDQRVDAEKKYAYIPSDMQVTESTRPGDCWRARDAVTGMSRLDYCATIEPSQHVTIPEDAIIEESDSISDDDLNEVLARDVFVTRRAR